MTSSTVDDVVVVIDVVNVNDWWVDDDGQCDQIWQKNRHFGKN